MQYTFLCADLDKNQLFTLFCVLNGTAVAVGNTTLCVGSVPIRPFGRLYCRSRPASAYVHGQRRIFYSFPASFLSLVPVIRLFSLCLNVSCLYSIWRIMYMTKIRKFLGRDGSDWTRALINFCQTFLFVGRFSALRPTSLFVATFECTQFTDDILFDWPSFAAI